MRLLGIDFGFKRIGLAIAETEVGIITARPTIEASGTLKKDAERIAVFAKSEEVAHVVLGLPIEENGAEGKMARICRLLAGHLEDAGVKVELVDERMTSVEAEDRLRASATSGKRVQNDLRGSQIRRLKDGEAARLILERFIHEREVS